VALVLLPASVAAQELIPEPDTYEVYRLPEGFLMTSTNGLEGDWEYQCYGIEDFKVLLRIDADLKSAEGQVGLLGEQVLHLANAVVATQAAVADANDQVVLATQDRDRLRALWEAENEARLKAENRPMWGNSLPWILTAALGVTSATLLVTLAIQ
jgi:hypothetical protein